MKQIFLVMFKYFENNILNISVIENPIIESIEITGVKNKTFIKDITEAISLKIGCLLMNFSLRMI